MGGDGDNWKTPEKAKELRQDNGLDPSCVPDGRKHACSDREENHVKRCESQDDELNRSNPAKKQRQTDGWHYRKDDRNGAKKLKNRLADDDFPRSKRGQEK